MGRQLHIDAGVSFKLFSFEVVPGRLDVEAAAVGVGGEDEFGGVGFGGVVAAADGTVACEGAEAFH